MSERQLFDFALRKINLNHEDFPRKTVTKINIMKHLQLVLWLIGWTVSCMAQNYQLIQPNHVNHFLADREILSIRIDSMQTVGAKTHYYNHKTMAPTDPINLFCALIQVDSSWLGTSIEVDTNGFYTFKNHQNKSLMVYSQAALNVSWTFYDWANGDYIDAEITSIDTMTILGVLDSVKTISFQARNMGLLVSHPINNKTIRFSKNHGLIDWFAIGNFPDKLDEYHLVGTTNGNLGIANLEAAGIFDYEVGDEFHIRSEYRAGTSPWSYRISYRRDIVLDKRMSNNQDTIIYTFQVCENSYQNLTMVPDPDTLFTIDTIQEAVLLSSKEWSALSYELREDGQSYAVFVIDDVFNRLTKRFDQEYYRPQPDSSCWALFLGSAPPYRDYIKGLGGLYQEHPDPWAAQDRKLVYYNKNGETAGTPLTIQCLHTSTVMLAGVDDQVQIYPNPFQHKTTISIQNFDVNDDWTLELYNSLGKQLRSVSIQDAQFDLEKAGLPAGMYICQLHNQQKKKTYTQKIIIE